MSLERNRLQGGERNAHPRPGRVAVGSRGGQARAGWTDVNVVPAAGPSDERFARTIWANPRQCLTTDLSQPRLKDKGREAQEVSQLLRVVHSINRSVRRPSTSVNYPSFHPQMEPRASQEPRQRGGLLGAAGQRSGHYFRHLSLNELKGRGDYDRCPGAGSREHAGPRH